MGDLQWDFSKKDSFEDVVGCYFPYPVCVGDVDGGGWMWDGGREDGEG